MRLPRWPTGVLLTGVLMTSSLATRSWAAGGPPRSPAPAPVSRGGSGPWVGIELAPGKSGGVGIKHVIDGSPAATAHIQVGEEVVAVDGKKVETAQALIAAVRARGVGQHLTLNVVGGAKGARQVDVLLEARPGARDMQRHALMNNPAPEFTPKVLSGAPLARLSSLRGSVVLLDFFASWCMPCMAALPEVEAMHERLGPKGLRVVGIAAEAPAVVARLAESRKLRYSVAADEDEAISGSYRVYALPTMVLIDKKGVVREISVADLDGAHAMIERLLAE